MMKAIEVIVECLDGVFETIKSIVESARGLVEIVWDEVLAWLPQVECGRKPDSPETIINGLDIGEGDDCEKLAFSPLTTVDKSLKVMTEVALSASRSCVGCSILMMRKIRLITEMTAAGFRFMIEDEL